MLKFAEMKNTYLMSPRQFKDTLDLLEPVKKLEVESLIFFFPNDVLN
jgi:hypothetical protein